MSYLSGLSREFEFPEDLKKKVNIGILGSFRRPHLEMLKRHLCDDEGWYCVRTATMQETSVRCGKVSALRPEKNGIGMILRGRLIQSCTQHSFAMDACWTLA